MTAARWAWRHHCLEVDLFVTLREAVEAAVWANVASEEALECIEHNGRILPPSEVWARHREMYPPEPEPAVTPELYLGPWYVVEVQAPAGGARRGGCWVELEGGTCRTPEAAESKRAAAAAAVGAERVRVRKVEARD